MAAPGEEEEEEEEEDEDEEEEEEYEVDEEEEEEEEEEVWRLKKTKIYYACLFRSRALQGIAKRSLMNSALADI